MLTVESDLGLKRKEIGTHVTMWMDLENSRIPFIGSP